MKAKIQLFAVVIGACLTSGCVIPAPYPYDRGPVEYGRPVVYGGPVEYGAPGFSGEFIVPEVIIVENGVRHDRFFYQRHPEFYQRDQRRYPERFAHVPSLGHGPVEYRGHVPPSQAVPGRPNAYSGDPHHAPPEDTKSKKKKHHDDDDHDHH